MSPSDGTMTLGILVGREVMVVVVSVAVGAVKLKLVGSTIMVVGSQSLVALLVAAVAMLMTPVWAEIGVGVSRAVVSVRVATVVVSTGVLVGPRDVVAGSVALLDEDKVTTPVSVEVSRGVNVRMVVVAVSVSLTELVGVSVGVSVGVKLVVSPPVVVAVALPSGTSVGVRVGTLEVSVGLPKV